MIQRLFLQEKCKAGSFGGNFSVSLFLVSQREDSFSLQLLLPQPVYPSPNAIYPSLQPPGNCSRSINISQTKVQSQKCTWLDRAERNFPSTHPHSAAAVPGIHFFNPVPCESLNSHLSWARQGWELARSDAPFN